MKPGMARTQKAQFRYINDFRLSIKFIKAGMVFNKQPSPVFPEMAIC